VAEPGDAMTQEQRPAVDMTNAPTLDSGSEDNVTFKVNEEKSVPVSDDQSLTIKAKPARLQ